jgi:hypothetical protein
MTTAKIDEQPKVAHKPELKKTQSTGISSPHGNY